MVLRIDPRYPLVWRSPTSLQFGVAAPVVVLHEVSEADEHMIAALAKGISAPGLQMVAASCGATDDAMQTLLAQLAPALEKRIAPVVRSVTVVGTGPTSAHVVEALRGGGVTVRVATGADDAVSRPCDLAIAIGHFVLAPELHGLWLRRDIPHLPVVLSDTSATVGPVVEPGVGPCMYCLQRYRTDADPAWPALSAQLWGRRTSIETALVAGEVAAAVSRLALARLDAGHAASVHLSTEISVATGETTVREWLPHPECGCVAVSVAARPGTGSPAVALAGSRRSSSR